MKIRNLIYPFLLLFMGCTAIPEGLRAVGGFQAERYLGTWYEIARLDHSFERGLNNVSATYTRRPDGGIDVLNRGYDGKTGQWKEARGKAYFTGKTDEGRLKVSFFGPFYGAYNIIALDKESYRYALVCGPDRSYLWILAREKQLDKITLDQLVQQAGSLGFATEKLIYVSHK
jgi:apolipoprotein D and lipocalin family protein